MELARREGMKKSQAFTLVELMIVLGVAAILATMAAPAFWNMIQNQRATTQANELVTAVNLARSEAVKRGERVELCASADPDAGSCGGSDWTAGWVVRLDGDPNGVIRVWGALPATANLNETTGGEDRITYTSRGEVLGSRTFDLWFDGCTGDQQRNIRVNAAGRPSVTRLDTECS